MRVRLLAGLIGVAALAVMAPSLDAQSAPQSLDQLRLEYRSAKAAQLAAQRAWEVFDRRFRDALTDATVARRDGDEARHKRALAAAQTASEPVRDHTVRVEETGVRLRDARASVIAALRRRQELLVSQLSGASASRRADLNIQLTDITNELDELEAEAQAVTSLRPVARPDITFDPRDTPQDLRDKAEILERTAAMYDSTMVVVDREIAALQDRQRLDRARQDALADLFDDRRTPVRSGPPIPDRAITGDSLVGGRSLTLEERIGLLRTYRAQLEEERDRTLIRAEQFRRAIGIIG